MSGGMAGWHGAYVRASSSDALTSTYTGMPRGVVRSSRELLVLLQGGRVDYLRADVDEKRQQQLRDLLVRALELAR